MGNEDATIDAELPGPAQVGEIAEALAERAANDSGFHAQLEAWIETAGSIHADNSVSNTVLGPVSGSVFQVGNVRVERHD